MYTPQLGCVTHYHLHDKHVLSENIYEANGHISATIKKLKISFYVVSMNVQIQGIKACLKSKREWRNKKSI